MAARLPAFEHVNLQTALDAWTAEPGRSVAVHGITLPPHYEPVTLQQLVTGEGIPPLRLSAPSLVDLPNGPGSTLACLLLAALLVEDARGRYVVMVAGPTEHSHDLRVEVAGLPVEAAQAVHAELDELRSRLNVYRGHVLDVSLTPMGGVSLTFGEVPLTARADVILPEVGPDPGRAARARGVGTPGRPARRRPAPQARAAALRAARHRQDPHHALPDRADDGYTRLLLTGRALHVIGSAAELARDLQPAVIVLEDVDLVAEDRSFGPGSSSVLFDLLDAMDGAAGDADLLFVLTTNRADLLEPALAARPGRVDVAVEIDLPDARGPPPAARPLRPLGPLQLSDAETEAVIERTDGVTASFLKELLRRAVLESLFDHTPLDDRDRRAHRPRPRRPARQQPAGHPHPARRRQRPRVGPAGRARAPALARAAGLLRLLSARSTPLRPVAGPAFRASPGPAFRAAFRAPAACSEDAGDRSG